MTRPRWTARLRILTTWTLVLTLLLELGSRAFWTIAKDVPLVPLAG